MARGGNAQCNAKSPAVGGWELGEQKKLKLAAIKLTSPEGMQNDADFDVMFENSYQTILK